MESIHCFVYNCLDLQKFLAHLEDREIVELSIIYIVCMYKTLYLAICKASFKNLTRGLTLINTPWSWYSVDIKNHLTLIDGTQCHQYRNVSPARQTHPEKNKHLEARSWADIGMLSCSCFNKFYSRHECYKTVVLNLLRLEDHLGLQTTTENWNGKLPKLVSLCVYIIK